MLNFDNTVNYAPSFKKIDESIESINTLLTSLLLDTYTNQTFIYSDINVIRVNTSQNYDSIQSLSAGLPMKLDSSASSNFFMKSNSGIFASSSTLSDKMNVSDSTNFFTLSNSEIFASTSQLGSKMNVSDFESISTQFALNSSVTSELDLKLNASKSTAFASTSDLASKFDASESTYFLPSSDFTIPTFSMDYLSNLSNFMDSSSDSTTLTFTNLIYNMIPTSFSGALQISNQPLLYNLSLTGNLNATDATIRNLSVLSGSLNLLNDSLQGVFNNNSINAINCTLNGTIQSNNITAGPSICISGSFKSNIVSNYDNLALYGTSDNGLESNTFSNVSSIYLNFQKLYGKFSINTVSSVKYFDAYNGIFSQCQFTSITQCDLHGISNAWYNKFSKITHFNMTCDSMWNNTFEYIDELKLKPMRPLQNTMSYVCFTQNTHMSIDDFSLKYNTFSSCEDLMLNNVCCFENEFKYVTSITIKIRPHQTWPVVRNTFSTFTKIVVDIDSYTSTDSTNRYSYNRFDGGILEFNIGPHVEKFDIAAFIGILGNRCFIDGLNINIPEYAKNYSLTKDFANQIVSFINSSLSGQYSKWSRYHLISFNSTNRWVNSGFNTTLSSYCDIGLLAEHSGTTEYDVQGSVSSTVCEVAGLKYGYFQPKFSPNYDSIKHYMVLYSNSFIDYYEMDPHALEAGHNNNACENIMLMKDYEFYQGLPYTYGNCTFIQWPSTRMTMNKSCYSNNTLLDTISNLTSRIRQGEYTDFEYTVGGTGQTYNYLSYRVSSSQLSSLFNTSSSSQLYAGFTTSGTFGTRSGKQILKF